VAQFFAVAEQGVSLEKKWFGRHISAAENMVKRDAIQSISGKQV
jgi:hypothetical protein